jgi:hypothetical protein
MRGVEGAGGGRIDRPGAVARGAPTQQAGNTVRFAQGDTLGAVGPFGAPSTCGASVVRCREKHGGYP